MRRNIPAIINCLLVLGGCNLPQPIVGSLHSVNQSEIQNKTVTKRYRATCFPIGFGVWVSTCHRKNERITQGIAQGTVEIEVAGKRFPVIGVRFSKDEDYCLLAINDKSHTGFTLASTEPVSSDFKIIISEVGNKFLSASPCPWPKSEARPRSDDKADHRRAPANTLFPLRASGPIVHGTSGSPVLNAGKVVGLVIRRDTAKEDCVYVIPLWLMLSELDEMVTELKHESQERGCQ